MALSEEQRKAIGENLRKAREKKAEQLAAAKAAAAAEAPEEEETPTFPEEDLTTNIKNDDLKAIMDRLAQLERIAGNNYATAPQPRQGVMAGNGGLVGTREKFITDPLYYPDPREKLAQEPRLRRFAFDVNYDLNWEVSTTQYKTIDNVNTTEPRFTIELVKIVMDEETGEPTDGRYVIRRAVFHEDPDAAIAIAREQGLTVDTTNERQFLDDMRYLRIKAWLLDAFYPPKNTGKKAKKQMVIGNRVVEYYEVSSVDAESVPFKELKGKIQ